MKKKGIELSLNTIIIAVLLLFVAAVIIAIFTGGLRDIVPWFKAASSCEGQGNKCYDTAEQCVDGQPIKSGCENNQYCCLRENEKNK